MACSLRPLAILTAVFLLCILDGNGQADAFHGDGHESILAHRPRSGFRPRSYHHSDDLVVSGSDRYKRQKRPFYRPLHYTKPGYKRPEPRPYHNSKFDNGGQRPPHNSKFDDGGQSWPHNSKFDNGGQSWPHNSKFDNGGQSWPHNSKFDDGGQSWSHNSKFDNGVPRRPYSSKRNRPRPGPPSVSSIVHYTTSYTVTRPVPRSRRPRPRNYVRPRPPQPMVEPPPPYFDYERNPIMDK